MARKKETAELRGVAPDDINEDGTLKPEEVTVFGHDHGMSRFPEGRPLPEDIMPDLLSLKPDDENSPNAGWCPNGSWSGGICRPYNNVHRARWMSAYGSVKHLRVQDAILPGTHQSAFDKQAASTPSMETCQDVSVHTQLHAGIRAIDIRVQFYFGYPAGDSRRFMIFHSGNNGRTIQGDILNAVLSFYSDANNKGEVIVLDFHQFKGFTPAAHLELAGIIKNSLRMVIAPPRFRSFNIAQLATLGKTVIIAYNDGTRNSDFWPGVNQRWIGHNQPSSSQLKAFVDKVAAENKPAWELRAIQAAKYTKVFHVPDDMSPDVMSWFAAGTAASPIMKHFIINTDWSLRHRLVDNIIYANQFRFGYYNAAWPCYEPTNYIPYRLSLIYWVFYGCSRSHIILPDPANSPYGEHGLVVAIGREISTTLTIRHSIFPADIHVPMSAGDLAAFVYLNKRWEFLCDVYTPNTNGATVPAPPFGEKFARYVLSDGNYVSPIRLPRYAEKINSVVFVTSNATLDAVISGEGVVGGHQVTIRKGDTYAFAYEGPGRWRRLS
ncbi:hypothetical protein [Pseudomonas sp. PGPPP1]|uniref:hypothetical protein n=1 Tax=Pseudomonas sp. PGPPP1 TaxID=2015553 RepID=UPI00257EB7FD|nr:hypothetical protein [Pseudomonas sp. PGPPP1]